MNGDGLMDPDAALTELRNLATLAANLEPSDPDAHEIATRMGEVFDGLDGWLAGGGFLPADWMKGRKA
jgi:hypothetical protein